MKEVISKSGSREMETQEAWQPCGWPHTAEGLAEAPSRPSRVLCKLDHARGGEGGVNLPSQPDPR